MAQGRLRIRQRIVEGGGVVRLAKALPQAGVEQQTTEAAEIEKMLRLIRAANEKEQVGKTPLPLAETDTLRRSGGGQQRSF